MGCSQSTEVFLVLGSSRIVIMLGACIFLVIILKNIQILMRFSHHSKSRFFFLEGYLSRQSSPSSPHPGCSQLRSECKQIHSFFSESYFTHASVMQWSRSRAPDTMLDSFSSGKSSLTYCDSFSNSLMSARVPTPLGSLAAASRTNVKIVTQAGRSLFSKGWSRGFPVRTEILLATGATVTFLPSSRLQTHGLVGLEYRWNYCRRQLSTHSLFLGLIGSVILYIIPFLSPLSQPRASNYSWHLILEASYLKNTLGANSSSMKSSSSSSVSVAWLFSLIYSTEERSLRDSTELTSSSKANLSGLKADDF